MILDEFHLLAPEGAGRLLKTIEEPPDSIDLPDPRRLRPARPDHDLVAVCPDRLPRDRRRRDRRTARRGGRGTRLGDGSSRAAHGDLERARVLATDPALAERRAAFAEAPHELDGTGAVAMRTAARPPRADRRRRRSRSRSVTPPRSPNSTSGSRPTVNAAAARSNSTSATSASCVATAPTNCAAASPRWRRPTATPP